MQLIGSMLYSSLKCHYLASAFYTCSQRCYRLSLGHTKILIVKLHEALDCLHVNFICIFSIIFISLRKFKHPPSASVISPFGWKLSQFPCKFYIAAHYASLWYPTTSICCNVSSRCICSSVHSPGNLFSLCLRFLLSNWHHQIQQKLILS